MDINRSDNQGQTPLGLVAKTSFSKLFDFCKLGLSYRLDLTKTFVVKKYEHTILTYIVDQEKSLTVLSLISDQGADINQGDGLGYTPLIHLIRQNREEEVKNLIKTHRKLLTKTVDNEGKNIIHHVVTPRQFGSYENISLLEFLSKYADINHIDKHGKPPLYYAKAQESGKMEKALFKLKVKETEMGPVIGVNRTTTTIFEGIDFPSHPNNYEHDFEKFVEEC